MFSQAVVIGIAVGVFFAGLGIGYAVFQGSDQLVTSTSTNAETELERYKIAERLADEHLETFDTLDFDVFTTRNGIDYTKVTQKT